MTNKSLIVGVNKYKLPVLDILCETGRRTACCYDVATKNNTIETGIIELDILIELFHKWALVQFDRIQAFRRRIDIRISLRKHTGRNNSL